MRASRGACLCGVLSLIGMGVTAYLAFLHIALLRGELLGGSVCGATGTIFNCHAVTASPQGTLLGIPLALWGWVGYLTAAVLAFIAWQFSDWAPSALTLLAGLSLLFVGVDLGLLTVMLVQIHYLCPLCLFTYLLNLLLLLTALWALGVPWRRTLQQIPTALSAFRPRSRVAVVWLFWSVIAVGAVSVVSLHAAVTYASRGAPGMLRKQLTQFISQQRAVVVETSRDPFKGVTNGTLQIVEFSDFLCPSCQRASQVNPILLASHRREATFVFKHFPLDQACNHTITRTVHPMACHLAAATECAHEQGKFWELHDRIFVQGAKYPVAQLEDDAARIGLKMDAFRACLQRGSGLEAVKRDVTEAARLGVTSTPTYVVNGVVMAGVFTPAMFEEFVSVLRRRP